MNNTRKTRRAEHQENTTRAIRYSRRSLSTASYNPVPPSQDARAESPPPPPKRARGRPRGHPPALTLEERRARNAELERGRRDEMSSLYDDIRDVVGQSPGTSRADVLRAVAAYIEELSARPSVADISRQNSLLEEQIRLTARAESSPGGRAKERTKSGSISGRGEWRLEKSDPLFCDDDCLKYKHHRVTGNSQTAGRASTGAGRGRGGWLVGSSTEVHRHVKSPHAAVRADWTYTASACSEREGVGAVWGEYELM
ncbi:hypothetical protein EVAR_96385_1 [Eumeta japonica]|uniref:BHLH domain-containing protein n=1 Tax=Eumeta variegata TaxID=151549 RepID=A0A4C1WDW7_EUMVA|nr:hypothetical protein EVAR_96385_1 [Eumeta japonica]